MKYSIVTLNWRQWLQTLDWLQHLESQNLSKVLIVVVENGSGDESRSEILTYLESKYSLLPESVDRNKFFQLPHESVLVFVTNQQNLGFAGGMNEGLRVCRDYGLTDCLLLNNDAYIDRENLEKIAKSSQENNALICPLVVKYDDPSKVAFSGNRWPHFIYGIQQQFESNQRFRNSGYLEGSILFLPKIFLNQKLESDGFIFDENYFLYCEDVDLCLRAKSLGFPCLIDTEARGQHKVSFSTGGEGSPTAYYYITRNRIYLARKWFSKPHFFFFSVYYILSRMVLILLRYRKSKIPELPTLIVQAIRDGYAQRMGPRA